jgi:hypothetical protein
MMVAVESGQERVGEWVEVQRNIIEDIWMAIIMSRVLIIP